MKLIKSRESVREMQKRYILSSFKIDNSSSMIKWGCDRVFHAKRFLENISVEFNSNPTIISDNILPAPPMRFLVLC